MTAATVIAADVSRFSYSEARAAYAASVSLIVRSPIKSIRLELRFDNLASLEEGVARALRQLDEWGAAISQSARCCLAERTAARRGDGAPGAPDLGHSPEVDVVDRRSGLLVRR